MLKIKTKTNTKGILNKILCLAVALGVVVGGGFWTKVWAASAQPDVHVEIVGATVKDKVYDGNMDAEVESVELECDGGSCDGHGLEFTATAEFADPEVGDNKPVTVTIEKDWPVRYVLDSSTFKTTASILAASGGESGGGESGDPSGETGGGSGGSGGETGEEPGSEPGDDSGDDLDDLDDSRDADDESGVELADESGDEATDEAEQSGTTLTVPDTGEMAEGAEFASGNLAMAVATSVMVGMAVAAATFWTGVKILRKSQE